VTPTHHLAQINIARMLAPLDDPVMAGFVSRLPEINALAEAAPGFVWRLQTPAGDATLLRVFDDSWIIINMSVWKSVDALYQYTYYSPHVEVYRKRTDWFSKLDSHAFAMWWIPAVHIPTPEEGRRKLEALRTHGPTPLAFTFRQHFTPEESLTFASLSEESQKDS
jgi:hypothetical protein